MTATMDAGRLIDQLEAGGRVLQVLLTGLDIEAARERPTEREWSVLEIACHLLDEERDDFKRRLELTLAGDQDWPPIDPEAWVDEHRYSERELSDVVTELATERAASVRWLRSLGGVDWGLSHQHGNLGDLRAGDLLASWVAHDSLHLRQLAKRLYQEVQRLAAPFSPDYAGPF